MTDKKPNILFILVDALRARNLGCYGYQKKTSPNIDRLSNQGVLFERAFSCTNMTDPSLTTIFSGKYPISHGIVYHKIGLGDKETQRLSKVIFLSEILKTKGYRTLAVDWLGRWHRRGYDYYSGIETSKKIRRFSLRYISSLVRFMRLSKFMPDRSNKPRPLYPQADTVSRKAIKLIEENCDRKFFLFLHFWDPHFPYFPPTSHVRRFWKGSKNDPNNTSIKNVLDMIKDEKLKSFFAWNTKGITNIDYLRAQYDAEIAFVDYEVGKILRALEKYGISDNTLVILTADHGESLTEHGIFFNHHGLFDVSVHVPLILRYGHLPKNRRVHSMVQHVDILPTVIELIESEPIPCDGKSMIPLVENDEQVLHSAVFCEEARFQRKRAIRTDKYKFIRSLSKEGALCSYCGQIHGGVEELYDLERDPEENHNILELRKEKADELKNRLLQWERVMRVRADVALISPGSLHTKMQHRSRFAN